MAERAHPLIFSGPFEPGDYESKVLNVDDDVTHVNIILDRDALPDTGKELLKVRGWLYLGGRWVKSRGFGVMGGEHTHRFGFPVFYSSLPCEIPPGEGRRFKVVLSVLTPVNIRKIDVDFLLRPRRRFLNAGRVPSI